MLSLVCRKREQYAFGDFGGPWVLPPRMFMATSSDPRGVGGISNHQNDHQSQAQLVDVVSMGLECKLSKFPLRIVISTTIYIAYFAAIDHFFATSHFRPESISFLKIPS